MARRRMGARTGKIVTAVRETGDGSQSIVVSHEGGLEPVYSLCGHIRARPGGPAPYLARANGEAKFCKKLI